MTWERMKRRVRLELDDMVSSWQSTARGDGYTYRFDLPVSKVEPSGFRISIDGTEQTLDTDYTIDYESGVVQFAAPPADDSTVVFEGRAARVFDDEDIEMFLEEAIAKHNVRRNPPINPEPVADDGTIPIPDEERQPIAILAAVEGLWAMLSSASFDINIYTPEGMSIPRDQRHRQLRALIADQQERYRAQAQMLNVGLNRIELMPLRRKSRTTGRLVPLYESLEFDERRRPKRLWQPIDQGVDTTVEDPDWYVDPYEGGIDPGDTA